MTTFKPWRVFLQRCCIALPGLLVSLDLLIAAEPTWKAGTAATVITPQKPMWMAGYGNRDHPAEGKLQDLWLKVLVLDDGVGHRAVVVTTDTLGIPRSMYEHSLAALREKFGLEPSQVMLSASHTHCGPVLRQSLYDAYPIDANQIALIEEYSAELERDIVDTVGQALANLAPARLRAGQGTASFAVNRRNNLEPDVAGLREQHALKGPVDHDVPVLLVESTDGQLKAVVFGYACHNTTLNFYQWCGDYAGFAQLALERSHPGALAMFYMGCGADQNPIPRREVYLAERYGNLLAAAVEEVLLQAPACLEPRLATAMEMVDLNLDATPTEEELEAKAKGPPTYATRWASRLLGELKAGKPLTRTYPYPVQVWKLGERQLWIKLGGEVVVDYALRFKQEFGAHTWVTAYCNDLMAYIPSHRVLREDIPPRESSRWGYEGNTSMMIYGLPAERWSDDIEERIGSSVRRLVAKENR